MNLQSTIDIQSRVENAYTDAPQPYPNPIPGSFQLIFWLLFHPSAWRNYVAHIDPTLRPDFCLAELSLAQWRNPTLQRLLAIVYLICPLLVGSLVGLSLWAAGRPGSDILVGIGVGIGISAGISIGVGGGVSVAGGVVGSAVLGLGLGAVGSAVLAASGDAALSKSAGAALIAAYGAGAGMVGSTMGHAAGPGSAYPLARWIGGVVIGVVISSAAVGVAVVAAGGVAFGVAIGWCTRSWLRGTVSGIVLGLLGGLALDAAVVAAHDAVSGLAFGVGGSVLLSSFFALPHALARRPAGAWAGATAGALGVGGLGAMAFGLLLPSLWPFGLLFLSLGGTLLGLTISWWRPVLSYPFQAAWNFALHRADEQAPSTSAPPRRCLLRYHSAFWDEFQRLRMPGLDDHLILVMERNPSEGQAAMDYLSATHQRWAAQAAQIELDARELGRCADVTAIAHAHRGLTAGELEGPASALLRSFSRVSQDVNAALRQESVYNQRLALSGVEDRLDGLLRELTRSSERYAVRFRPIANAWRQIVAAHGRALAEAVEVRQEIDNPYVIGIPLTEQQEIFVGRTDVSARIEQLLLDRRRPPLLLYGQRRMGKTSLLTNLGRLLPSTIVPLFVDLQGPATRASQHAGFLYNIARGMVDSAERQRGLILPPLPREALATDPFTRFDEWLDEVEGALGESTALLTLDEFEVLDDALTEGRFNEKAILGMLRHLIQHRSRFKVLLAGSHTLDELRRWSSYLINVQVVHIGYLKEHEARQLVERPVEGFALRYEPDASQRVLDLTRGHPALVQLLCSEIVALKNEQPPAVRRLARLDDVEAAVPEALSHGSFFFADIEQNQVDAAGMALLRFLAARGEGAVVGRETLTNQFPDQGALDRALDLLIRRELIEQADEGYRIQVETIRRWFAAA